MKPSQYTFIVVPDHDGKNRQFSISRKGTLILIFSIISILSSMVIALFILIPKALDYERMENRYDDVIEERIEVLELYRDLERMKQMELVVQKSLGSYLAESDSVDDKLVEMMDEQVLRSSYLKNIPSLIPVSGVITQTMINDNSEDIRKHYGIDLSLIHI